MDRTPGIYDAQGRWIAPLEGNEALPPVPRKLTEADLQACAGLQKKAA